VTENCSRCGAHPAPYRWEGERRCGQHAPLSLMSSKNFTEDSRPLSVTVPSLEQWHRLLSVMDLEFTASVEDVVRVYEDRKLYPAAIAFPTRVFDRVARGFGLDQNCSLSDLLYKHEELLRKYTDLMVRDLTCDEEMDGSDEPPCPYFKDGTHRCTVVPLDRIAHMHHCACARGWKSEPFTLYRRPDPEPVVCGEKWQGMNPCKTGDTFGLHKWMHTCVSRNPGGCDVDGHHQCHPDCGGFRNTGRAR
jgi:hypothetical protein